MNVHISRVPDKKILGRMYSLLKEVKGVREQRALIVHSNQTIAQSFVTCVDPKNITTLLNSIHNLYGHIVS